MKLVDLSALEEAAREATQGARTLLEGAQRVEVRAQHADGSSTWVAECRTKEDARHIAAFSPGVALPLLELANAADAWRQMKRPCSYSEADHMGNPTINCASEHEARLALAVAALRKALEGVQS
jgi:hypothetical protein